MSKLRSLSLVLLLGGCAKSSASPNASPAPDAGPTSGEGGRTQCPALAMAGSAVSQWVHGDASGKLAYKPLPSGDRILDFSNAGYGGGGVAIPSARVVQTIMPSGDDDTAAIQAAIDAVAEMPLDAGARGAVLLGPGTFNVSATITIAASGVVLRGSGSGSGGTTLNATGAPRYILAVHGSGSWQTTGKGALITDTYVPSGARAFHVADATKLAVGASVLVDRPVTPAWIHFMGMDTLVRDGGAETWITPDSSIHSDRVIAAIAGNEITLDAPLSDALDAQYVSPPGASVSEYTFTGRIAQVGVEALHVVVPKQSVPIDQPTYDLLQMDAVIDAWIKDVVGEEVTNGFVIEAGAKRVTIEDSSIIRTAPIDGTRGYPFEYSIDGQQTLVQRCAARGDHLFSFATKSRSPGPNVLLDFSVQGSPMQVQPHERWSTGLLVDGANVPGGEIDFINRGIDGTGHGWTIGFSVVWNATARSLLLQQPPGAQNWAIGTSGTFTKAAAPGSTQVLPQGEIDSPGSPVAPKSLYLAQLCERIGPQALANIGY